MTKEAQKKQKLKNRRNPPIAAFARYCTETRAKEKPQKSAYCTKPRAKGPRKVAVAVFCTIAPLKGAGRRAIGTVGTNSPLVAPASLRAC
jgi:hypothetical protein